MATQSEIDNALLVVKKNRARTKLTQAVKAGRITKLTCAVCGDENTFAHHTDYEKPLDVIWLCRQHHMEVHTKVAGFRPSDGYVHIHLALSPDLSNKLDALALAWGMKRPSTLERIIDKEYKAMLRKRQPLDQPTEAQ